MCVQWDGGPFPPQTPLNQRKKKSRQTPSRDPPRPTAEQSAYKTHGTLLASHRLWVCAKMEASFTCAIIQSSQCFMAPQHIVVQLLFFRDEQSFGYPTYGFVVASLHFVDETEVEVQTSTHLKLLFLVDLRQRGQLIREAGSALIV